MEKLWIIADAMTRRRELIEGLRVHATLDALRRSSFYLERRGEIEALLGTPEVAAEPGAVPRVRDFVRLVQWNLEKGARFDAIAERLARDPVLRWDDVVLLNEADHGMARSGNRHVARELASALGMHMAVGAAHLELTKGTGAELEVEGENAASLQGNAVLSRFPILSARVAPLPTCFEPYHFHEKRYGRRACLWAELDVGGRAWRIGAVHLEVRDTPRCRARQVAALLADPAAPGIGPCLIGGDLNCNGFSRGTRARTLAALWRLTARDPDRVAAELLRPDRGREPLFDVLRAGGFEWERLNAPGATAWAPLDALEDAWLLPAWLRRALQARLRPYGGYLRLKLDWIAGRGVDPLGDREVIDRATGAASRAPGAVELPLAGPERLSDHLPIHVDLRLGPG